MHTKKKHLCDCKINLYTLNVYYEKLLNTRGARTCWLANVLGNFSFIFENNIKIENVSENRFLACARALTHNKI